MEIAENLRQSLASETGTETNPENNNSNASTIAESTADSMVTSLDTQIMIPSIFVDNINMFLNHHNTAANNLPSHSSSTHPENSNGNTPSGSTENLFLTEDESFQDHDSEAVHHFDNGYQYFKKYLMSSFGESPENTQALVNAAEKIIQVAFLATKNVRYYTCRVFELLTYIMVESGTKKVQNLFSFVSFVHWKFLLQKQVKLDLSIVDKDQKTLLQHAVEGVINNKTSFGCAPIELVEDLLMAAPLSNQGGFAKISQIPNIMDHPKLVVLINQCIDARDSLTNPVNYEQFFGGQDIELCLPLFYNFISKIGGIKYLKKIDTFEKANRDFFQFSFSHIQHSSELVRKFKKRLNSCPELRALESLSYSKEDLIEQLKIFIKNYSVELQNKTATLADLALVLFDGCKKVREIEADAAKEREQQALVQTKIDIRSLIHRVQVGFYEAQPKIEAEMGAIGQIQKYLKVSLNEAETFVKTLETKKTVAKRDSQNARKGLDLKKDGHARLDKEYTEVLAKIKTINDSFEGTVKEQQSKIEKYLEENDFDTAKELSQTLQKSLLSYSGYIDVLKDMLSSFKDVLAGIRSYTQIGMKKFNRNYKPKSDRERTLQIQDEERQIGAASYNAFNQASSDTKLKLDEIENARVQKEQALATREKQRQLWINARKEQNLEKADAKQKEEARLEKKRITEEHASAGLQANCPDFSSQSYTPLMDHSKQASVLVNHPKIVGLPVYNHFATLDKLLTEIASRENSSLVELERERDALRFAIADLCEEIRKLPNGFVLEAEIAADFRHLLYKGPNCKVNSQEDFKTSEEYNEQLRHMVISLLTMLRERSAGKSELKALSEEEILARIQSPLFAKMLGEAKKLLPKKERPIPPVQELLLDIDQIYKRLETYKKMSDAETILSLAEKYCISMLGVSASLIRDHYPTYYLGNKTVYDEYIMNANNLRHGQAGTTPTDFVSSEFRTGSQC